MCFLTKPYCCYTRKHTWNRSELPRITVYVLSVFRSWLVVFFSNLKIEILTLSNKWLISYSKSLSSSNKLEILSKSSKETNEAFFMCAIQRPRLQHICSLVCDVVDFICDRKLFKAIVGSLITIVRSINYDSILHNHNQFFVFSRIRNLSVGRIFTENHLIKTKFSI